ncbi:Hypothetical predicted protein [Mytilus galloprovincialis]|uniref:non-specific serine/threonine protein kinase n=1 Tax=Mytilus galloprovincialis TaxID=29158 RepID=A0A8B6GH48_MYTGA|nr:Hypothetical predicted protein [Mytilus galloprovincialis]
MKESSMFGRGSYESFDMRCMVTGQFAVGKSSLVKLLVGDNVPEGRHATDGISLVEGRCGLDIETRSWIMIDPATYNALDVVYNKVLMTSIEEDESQRQTKTPEKQESVAKPGDSQNKEDTHSQKSDASKSPYSPVNLSDEPSSQPQAAQSVSPKTSSSESKKQQMKKKIKTKMTKKEIRKRMEKVLKTGKYKMKVGRLIFWDFGGQYVYYTTHQTFMTYRALFLVVFDGSKGLHEEIPDVLCFPGQHMTPTPAVFLLHWVNSILTYCKVVFAGIPKILFVATHKDKVPVEDVETRRALLYSEVEELFKDHEGRNHLVLDKQIFVNATDKNDQEIESLKKAITELTFDHPCWGEKMPNACVPLELEIAEMVAAGKQILSLVELEELNSISKVSVLDLEQLHDFLHFQHSLGKIIYFDTCQLRDYVIINPLFMVEVMRSFVTDKGFWPKKRRMQVIFSRMSESGIIRREDLYQIWEQKDFRPILRYKEFIFDILIHLDILAEQRRYDTATGSRLPVENFFVPCMVTQRNTTSFMNTECTPEKAICLAFVFKGTVIPPALPNRLISACLSMWTLKHYEGRKLLFSGFVVVSFDKAHDICVCIEGNKVLLYIVHRTSAGLIVPDIATGVKECLVTTMERISDFYQSTINVKHSQQLPFHIEYSCSELKCFICEEEALHSMTSEWVCDKHEIRHRAGNWVVWNQYKKKEQCEQNCSGLSDDALSKIPSDIELLRFSTKYPLNQMFELVTYLEMCEEWEAIKYNNGDRIEVAKFLVLTKWKQMKAGSNFQALAEALTTMNISKHLLCQVRRVRAAETGSFENVDPNTFRESEEVREKGAIMKKRKNKSEQKPHIPAEIELMADKRSVPLYLKLLESGYENKRDIRLVIVGQKGAGKTSLIKRLLNEGKTRAGLTSFLKRFIGRNNAEVNSTNGIEIHTIKCNPNSCDGIWNKLDGNYEENALYTRLLKPYEEKLVSGDKAKIEAAGNKTISEPTTTTTVFKQSEKLKPSVDTEYKQKTLEDSQVKQSEVSHKTGKENTLITNLNRRVDESNESETITQQPEKIKSPEDTEDDSPADTESHAKLPVAIEFHATNVGANVSQLQTEPPEGIVSQCKPQVTDSYHYQQQNLSLEKEKAYKDIKTMMEKSNFDLHDKDEYATFLLWDFAGDEEFYHTHQTFLSPDAIYLVVTKLDEAENKNAQG